MDLSYLKKLVRIVEQSKVDEIEIEEEGLRVRVARNPQMVPVPAAGQTAAVPAAAVPSAHSPAAVPAAQAPSAVHEPKYHEIKSPIVGTFYRAPAPDADPYVQIGQEVQDKTVLCIIEAMKLMNEIESDVAGKVAKILVENGQPVEYNQPLFLIEPV
ncbi:MAG TPA: acetyl-CoA carboxylase biotin carboxyl carrier protein [Bacteroidota bacterium]|nr:acetyl-CoA carboxylase biotin carboxyl carrier protein [Bacteroidota bacterium]